jgi:hypothetical protein
MDKIILYLILILFMISILSKITYESYSSDNSIKQNNAICFITRYLDPVLLNFAESCSKYNDIYIVVDDNTQLVSINKTSKVKILQINNNECINNNYIKSTWRFKLDVTGWDKAFYYFCENNKYDNVWFIEDDVFIPKPNTIYNIDLINNSSDLLCKDMINVTNNKSNNQSWLDKINNAKQLLQSKPIYWSWVCAMRCSSKLLKLIKLFKERHKQLYFHEILIPSLVKINNLLYKTIPELKNIIYRKDHNDSDIISNPTYLYHPIKEYHRHESLRQVMGSVKRV